MPGGHPPKAYLAYVHEEGGFVAQVAGRLSRARVHFDKYSFRPGEDFTEAIRRCLSDSDMFVLFASERSMKSSWVQFEIAEAEARRLQGQIQRLLVLTIDKSDTRALLPAWLKTGLVVHAPRAAQAFNVISTQLLALETGVRPETLFVGREIDLRWFSAKLAPPAGQPAPNIIVLHGLRGVGRRTFLARAARDYLLLELGPVLVLAETELLDWVHIALLQDFGEVSGQQELEAARLKFASQSEDGRAHALADLFAKASSGNRLPVLVDNGQLMDVAGTFVPEMERLFRAVTDRGDAYVALVTPREPQELPPLPMAVHRLGPLDEQSTRQLITQAFRSADVPIHPTQVAELTPWVAGYPPAVVLAVNAAQRVGLDVLLADKAVLRDLTYRHFAPVLERMSLGDSMLGLLRVLLPFEALPIRVIARFFEEPDEQIARRAGDLLSRNLLVPAEFGVGISPPIRIAVSQRVGDMGPADFRHLTEILREIYWRPDSNEIVPLAVVEAVTVASARAGPLPAALRRFGAYEVPSTLVRIADQAYLSDDWQTAYAYAERAIKEAPRREDAYVLAVKASIRMENWGEADRLLNDMERQAMAKRHYLRGFMLRRRGALRDAERAFRMAFASGDRGTRVKRELAYCLFLLNKVEEAREILEQLEPEIAAKSPVLLDLVAQVAIKSGRLDAAERAIEDLKVGGFEPEHFHRLSHLRLRQDRPDEALAAARRAAALVGHRIQVRAMEAQALIALGRLEEAQRMLGDLQPKSVRDRDIRTGLLCRLELQKGNWRRANELWQQMAQPDFHVNREVRVAVVAAALGDYALSAEEREQFLREQQRLETGFDEVEDLLGGELIESRRL